MKFLDELRDELPNAVIHQTEWVIYAMGEDMAGRSRSGKVFSVFLLNFFKMVKTRQSCIAVITLRLNRCSFHRWGRWELDSGGLET